MLNQKDFTEDELAMFELAFQLMDKIVETMSRSPFYKNLQNEWWHLKEKLGVTDWWW